MKLFCIAERRDMKEYDYKVTPTIVEEKICVFDFQITCRCLFWKRVVYAGSVTVNRSMETFVGGELIMNPKVQKYLSKAVGTSETQAEFIFKSFANKGQNSH